MNELAIFQFEEGREVRTLERDGEPWFVAKDVCDVLGLGNAREAVANLKDDEKMTLKRSEFSGMTVTTSKGQNGMTVTSSDGQNRKGGAQSLHFINEPGLYRLIFQSRKPEAERFKKWVFHEVLPAIRKKGFYALPGLMERLENLLDRHGKLLDDPKRAAYEELERFVQKNIVFDERHVDVASVDNLYREYGKEAEKLLDKREFMYKILLDHPEFGLSYKKKQWLLTNCYQEYRHKR